MTIEQLKQFFSERPQLTAHGTAKEAGISPRLMHYILSRERSLTERTIKKLMPVMIKYGFGKPELTKSHMKTIFEQSRSTKANFEDWFNFNYGNMNI